MSLRGDRLARQVEDLRSDRSVLVTTSQPYVHVSERIGSSDFVRCTADLFERDTLTITSIDDDYVLRVYRPGTWRTATVYDPSGHPAFSFTAETPADPLLSPEELRSARPSTTDAGRVASPAGADL